MARYGPEFKVIPLCSRFFLDPSLFANSAYYPFPNPARGCLEPWRFGALLHVPGLRSSATLVGFRWMMAGSGSMKFGARPWVLELRSGLARGIIFRLRVHVCSADRAILKEVQFCFVAMFASWRFFGLSDGPVGQSSGLRPGARPDCPGSAPARASVKAGGHGAGGDIKGKCKQQVTTCAG